MNVMFQIIANGNNKRDALALKPDLSGDRAKETIILNLSGVTASLLVFVTFGTTRPFREHMYASLVPACLQGRFAAADAPGLPYHARETVAQQRHTSIVISKGVDADVRLVDLAAGRSGRRGPASGDGGDDDDDDFTMPVRGGRPPHVRF